ncbi:hypothetical protein [Chitinophaga sp.]|uniref:hypothetical protein n=1 Tax=Chitinophaga sp. TaxID=1869181 RepID=UPI0031D76A95
MKQIIILSLGILLLNSCASDYYVAERPAPPPVIVQPAPPYPGAVWIGGEYRWRSGNYYYVQPHYVRPRPNRVYVPGHWNSGPRGHSWKKGHWR